jgi:hypothetical protein
MMNTLKAFGLDFYTLKSLRMMTVIYFLLPAFFIPFWGSASLSFGGSLLALSVSTTSTLFSLDARQRRPLLLDTLPIGRKDSVSGRYLFLFLHLLFLALILFLIAAAYSFIWHVFIMRADTYPTLRMNLLNAVGEAFMDISLIFTVFPFLFGLCLFLIAIQVPIYYRFGYDQARLFSLLFLLAAFGLPLLFLHQLGVLSSAYYASAFYEHTPYAFRFLLHSAILAALLFLSRVVSLRFSQKKA